jgi:hypothetical protein
VASRDSWGRDRIHLGIGQTILLNRSNTEEENKRKISIVSKGVSITNKPDKKQCMNAKPSCLRTHAAVQDIASDTVGKEGSSKFQLKTKLT